MTRCKSLIVAVGVMVSAAVGAQEPAKTGGAAGNTRAAASTSTPYLSPEAMVVGGAALVGTIVGLTTDGDSEDSASTSTSTSTGTRTR